MRITEVKPLGHFRLQLRFDDGLTGVIDLSHLAGRGVFQIWESPGVFEQVCVTSAGALEWPGEVDLCPDALYLQVVGEPPEAIFPTLNHSLSHA